MRGITRAIAAVELVLIVPAILFMSSLLVRNIQPVEHEPARTAQRIVAWYAASTGLGLWVLLIALPFTALVAGGLTLLRVWEADGDLRQAVRQTGGAVRGNLATLLVAAATLAAAAIVAVVVVHMMSD